MKSLNDTLFFNTDKIFLREMTQTDSAWNHLKVLFFLILPSLYNFWSRNFGKASQLFKLYKFGDIATYFFWREVGTLSFFQGIILKYHL